VLRIFGHIKSWNLCLSWYLISSKLKKEKIVRYLFDLIKNGYIECKFDKDNSKFYILT